MFGWLQSVSDTFVSVVIGALAFIGLGTPAVPLNIERAPTPVVEVESVVPTSTPTKKVEEVKPIKTVLPVTEPKIEEVAPKLGLEVLPEFTILLKPPKGQYTAEEIRVLNEEAINYFKAYSTCEGLAGFGLTYCKTFEASPEIQLWKSILQHNAEVDALSASTSKTSQ